MSTQPTQYAHSEEVKINNLTLNVTDLGGHEAMRRIWKNYSSNSNGIIYIIDTTDRERLEKSK